jgi:cob(I)alamin adenosyltransferase
MKIYTRKGDDGSTGLLFGDRVQKDAPAPTAYGTVDEAQAALGVARAEAEADLNGVLVALERDLWVLMAELATAPESRHKLKAGVNLVTEEMVTSLEARIDEVSAEFELPAEFVVPGENRLSALLDVARTVVRRAERASLAAAADGSQVVPYLNRLSDLVWTLARRHEGSARTARSQS